MLLINALYLHPVKRVLTYFLFNSGFVAFQLLMMMGYFTLKNRKWTNIINTYIGIGDILFFLILSLAFSPVNFIIFFLGSLLLTIGGYSIYKIFKSNVNTEIPLAGTMAIILMICVIYSCWKTLKLYDDGMARGVLELVITLFLNLK